MSAAAELPAHWTSNPQSFDAVLASMSHQVLADAARRIEAKTPWYETLGLGCGQAADGGADVAVETVLAFNVAEGLIDAANQTVLACSSS